MKRSRTAAARPASRRATLLWCCVGACSALLFSRPRVAAAQQGKPLVEARQHFDRGLVLLDRGELLGAAAEFEAANALIPAPLAAYDAALANARLGRPLAAVRLLRLADEQTAPPALREKIAALLVEEMAVLGTVLIRVTDEKGAILDDAEVNAEGYSAAELRVGQPVQVDPGSTRFSIAAPGHPPVERTVVVAAGTRQDLTVALTPSSPTPPPLVVHADTESATPFAAPGPRAGSGTHTPERAAPAPAVVVSPARKRGAPVAGVVTAIIGAAVMIAGGAVWWSADRGFATLSSDVEGFNASTGPGGSCSRGNNVSACRSESDALNQRHANLNRQRIIGAGAIGAGGVTALSGLFLCFSAGEAGRSNAGHSALQLQMTWGSAILQGAF